MRPKPKAVPLGFVVVAFQADQEICRSMITLRYWPGSGLRRKMAHLWRWDAPIPSKRRKALAWAEIRERNATVFGQFRPISSHFVPSTFTYLERAEHVSRV